MTESNRPAPRAVVAGVGAMGRKHAESLIRSRQFELVGLVDRSPDKCRDLATQSGAALHACLEDALAELRPDAVIVATPNSGHEPLARLCLEARCHALVEKPLCPDGSAARRLMRDFGEAGLVLMCGYTERFNPAFLAFRKELEEFGEVWNWEAERVGPFPQRIQECGVLLDLAVHDLDLVALCAGEDPETGFALSLQRRHTRCEDELRAVLRFNRGTLFSLRASWLSPVRRRVLRAHGEKGVLEADLLERRARAWDTAGGCREIPILQSTDALTAEHAAFRQLIEKGLEVSFSRHLANQTASLVAADALNRSLHVGGPVKLAEDAQ